MSVSSKLQAYSQLGGKGRDFLMQSEDVWEVTGVSFVDKFSILE